ncbi:MAG: hypothetical protein J5879_04935 [Clostridia bacterium]|nr:hypothetical protein [Clostridia bacterium]
MKFRRLVIITAAAALLSLCGCRTAETEQRDAQKIIEELVVDYGNYDIHELPPLG